MITYKQLSFLFPSNKPKGELLDQEFEEAEKVSNSLRKVFEKNNLEYDLKKLNKLPKKDYQIWKRLAAYHSHLGERMSIIIKQIRNYDN